MILVQRPTIEPDILMVTVQLDLLLGAVVATLAQTLKWPREKFHAVATVRLDMVADLSRHNSAGLEAVLTQRMFL
jgi:hypothetical protein